MPCGRVGRRGPVLLDDPHRRAARCGFDELADVAGHQSWANPNADLRTFAVTEGFPALGSRYRSEQVFFGKPNTADIEIVAFDRPTTFAYAVSQRARGKTRDAHPRTPSR